MIIVTLIMAGIFVVAGVWFFRRNRGELSGSDIARHVIFMMFIYAGYLAFVNGGVIVRWVFGREIHKHDPEEFIAGLIPLFACLLCFACAAIALGKERARHFKLYLSTFSFKKPNAPK